MKEIIRKALLEWNDVNIEYDCQTTRTNTEYIDIKFNGEIVKTIKDSDPLRGGFREELISAVDELITEFPKLHIVERKIDFMFFFPGFNTSSRKMVPVMVTLDESKISTTGIVSEKHDQVGKSKVMSVLAKYPDYDVYVRHGFAFRGAQEYKMSKGKEYMYVRSDNGINGCVRVCMTFEERMQKYANEAACADIKVNDNEIHVNFFSFNDMF